MKSFRKIHAGGIDGFDFRARIFDVVGKQHGTRHGVYRKIRYVAQDDLEKS